MIASRVQQLFQTMRRSISRVASGTSRLRPEDYPLLPNDWLSDGHPLYSSPKKSAINSLIERFPDRIEQLQCQANRVLAHQFNLLGSDWFEPIDADRLGKHGYKPIDWYLDPVRNLRFPRGVHYQDWNLYEMRPKNADVKYPWELARCQHLPVLGQAFLVFKQRQYAEEIFLQIEDFVEANPVGIGINWTCTMDVAIRALNWGVALDMIEVSGADYDEARLRNSYLYLFEHGHFIRANLEDQYEVTSNHYLSNIVGLFYLGIIFGNTASGIHWYAFSRDAIEKEISVQVLKDGADYESSIPYHRLVTELFLGAARLAKWVQDPFSADFMSILRRMVNYHYKVLRPDGKMPIVGDCDDGRLHILSDYGDWDPQDGLHLLGPAGFLFSESRWMPGSGDIAQWEAFWWGYPKSGPVPRRELDDAVALFPNAGVATARNVAGNYLLVTNSIVGTGGFGNHKHNDQLSFEYHQRGVPILIDSGSYVYTSDFDARNRFRSTRYHNTITVDGVEQNDTKPEWIFRMFPAEREPHHLRFEFVDGVVKYSGSHFGYHRFSHQAKHQRDFTFNLASGDLEIVDAIHANSQVELEWNFCCHPNVTIEKLDANTLNLVNANQSVMFKFPPRLRCSILDSEVSFSYGKIKPSTKLSLNLTIPANSDVSFIFTFKPLVA